MLAHFCNYCQLSVLDQMSKKFHVSEEPCSDALKVIIAHLVIIFPLKWQLLRT